MKLEPHRPLGYFLKRVVEVLLLLSLKGNLRGVYLRGKPPSAPVVLAMNHHSFYDGHLVWLLGRLAGRPTSLLVAEENLRAFPILSLVGALEAGQLREALRRLDLGGWVAVFPEGVMRFPGPLSPLYPGAQWLSKRARVPLLPVAARVVLRGFEHPEAFLLLGNPLPPGENPAPALEGLLRELDATLQATHPRQVPQGFQEVLRGQRSLEERMRPWVEALRRL